MSDQPVWRRKKNVFGCKEFMTEKVYQAQSLGMKANYEKIDQLEQVTKSLADHMLGHLSPESIRGVVEERIRQVLGEGRSGDNDDLYDLGQLASAAGCYAMHTLAYPAGDPPPNWPWQAQYWKPSADRRRNLQKAGALILAELDRLDRLESKKHES